MVKSLSDSCRPLTEIDIVDHCLIMVNHGQTITRLMQAIDKNQYNRQLSNYGQP